MDSALKFENCQPYLANNSVDHHAASTTMPTKPKRRSLIFFNSEILQRGMPQILLAAQVLHTADEARLDPLRRWPLHALGSWPGMFLDALPSRSRMARLELINAEPIYLPVTRSAMSAKAGLPRSLSTPSNSYSSIA